MNSPVCFLALGAAVASVLATNASLVWIVVWGRCVAVGAIRHFEFRSDEICSQTRMLANDTPKGLAVAVPSL